MSLTERKKTASESNLLVLDVESSAETNHYEKMLKTIPSVAKQDWARPLWIFIYTLLATYPDHPSVETQLHTYNFLIALQAVMPCSTCAEHFLAHLSSPGFRESLKSKIGFAKWIFHVHNDINLRTNKPTLSFEQSIDVVSQLVVWPREWDMPTPRVEPDGSIKRNFNAKKLTGKTNIRYVGTQKVMNQYWWIGVLYGIVCIGLGFGIGMLIEQNKKK